MKKNLFFFSVLCLIAFTLVGCSSEDDSLCSNDTTKMEFISLRDIPSLSDIIEQGVQPVAYIAIVKISETEYHSVTVLRSMSGGFICRDDQNNKRSVYLPKDIVASFYVSRPKLYNR